MNSIGWGGNGSDIGNQNGEVYTTPIEITSCIYVKRVFVSPENSKKLKIRITLTNEDALGKVHTKLVKSGVYCKDFKKDYDENKDFFIEYFVGLTVNFENTENEVSESNLLYELVIKWLQSIDSEL